MVGERFRTSSATNLRTNQLTLPRGDILVHLARLELAFTAPITITAFVALLGYRCIAENERLELPSSFPRWFSGPLPYLLG